MFLSWFLFMLTQSKKKKKKSAQLCEFFPSSSSGISDTLRRAACPRHSSGAITVDDSVYSLQEMSLKTGKDKLHLFVPIIKLEKEEAVGGFKASLILEMYFSTCALLSLLDKRKSKLPFCLRGDLGSAHQGKQLLSTLIDMLLRNSGKRQFFAAVY